MGALGRVLGTSGVQVWGVEASWAQTEGSGRPSWLQVGGSWLQVAGSEGACWLHVGGSWLQVGAVGGHLAAKLEVNLDVTCLLAKISEL